VPSAKSSSDALCELLAALRAEVRHPAATIRIAQARRAAQAEQDIVLQPSRILDRVSDV